MRDKCICLLSDPSMIKNNKSKIESMITMCFGGERKWPVSNVNTNKPIIPYKK